MKKTALIFILSTSLFGGAMAQNKNTVGFAKENIVVSGALAFSTSESAGTTKNEFKLSPSVGYFISDKFALGFNFGYGASKTETENYDSLGNNIGNIVTDNNDVVEVGLFGRYYYTPSKSFSIFNQIGFNYSSSNNKLAKLRTNGFNFEFSPGMNYFLSHRFSIQAQIGKVSFNSSKLDVQGAKSSSLFDIDLNLSAISFGLNYKL